MGYPTACILIRKDNRLNQVSWNHGSFPVGRVLIFVVFFTMFDKTTVLLIQVFDKFFTFYELHKIQRFLRNHVTHRIILFTYIFKIKLQRI